jgi:hypothetical protein
MISLMILFKFLLPMTRKEKKYHNMLNRNIINILLAKLGSMMRGMIHRIQQEGKVDYCHTL